MQNLPSSSLSSETAEVRVDSLGCGAGKLLPLLADHTARLMESTMASTMIMKSEGFSAIKSKDNGKAG